MRGLEPRYLPTFARWSPCQSLSWSASDNVNNGEHDHPHRVHKMPIQPQHVRAFSMFLSDRTDDGESHYNQQRQQTNNDMRSMQTDERIESCAEKVGLN